MLPEENLKHALNLDNDKPLAEVPVEQIFEKSTESTEVTEANKKFTELVNERISYIISYMNIALSKREASKKEISRKITYWITKVMSQKNAKSMLKMANETVSFWFKEAQPYLKELEEEKAKEEDKKSEIENNSEIKEN